MSRIKFVASTIPCMFILACASSAEEIDNPFKTAKVGDWVEYKMRFYSVQGQQKFEVPGGFTVKETVTYVTDKAVSVRFEKNGESLLKAIEKQLEVDLTKNYNFGVSILDSKEAKVDKESDEKIKVGDKEYDAHLVTTRLKEKVGFPERESQTVTNTWTAKDGPLGRVIKMERLTKDGNIIHVTTFELSSFGAAK